MAPDLNILERNCRRAVGWFAASLITQVIWLIGLGVLLLIPVFYFLGWPLVREGPETAEYFLKGLVWFQAAPSFLLAVAFLPFLSRTVSEPARGWAWAGLVAAAGAMICGVVFPLRLFMAWRTPEIYILLIALGLFLNSLAGGFFCLAAKTQILGAGSQAPEQQGGPTRQSIARGWDAAFRIFRNNLFLQTGFFAPLVVAAVSPTFSGSVWEGGPRLQDLVGLAILVFSVLSTLWCLLFYPGLAVYCLRVMRLSSVAERNANKIADNGADQAPGASPEAVGSARPGGDDTFGPKAGRLVWLVPGLMVLGGMLLGLAQLFDLSEDPVTMPAMEGPVSLLKSTVIVPAWEAALPEGKSVIWCGSFQEAWRRLATDVNGEPIQLEGMAGTSAELNRWNPDGQTWQGTRMLVESGTVEDGVLGRIERGLREKFPKVPAPQWAHSGAKDQAVLFAFLDARLKFTLPYFDQVMDFPTTIPGRKEVVRGFGIPRDKAWTQGRLRSQCAILHIDEKAGKNQRGDTWKVQEFCLDLDAQSKELQVLVARMPRPASLRQGWETLAEKIAAYRKKEGSDRTIAMPDSLWVPAMHWDLTARFLEGEPGGPKVLGGKLAGYQVGDASQRIRFRLDKSGADLRAAAKGEVARPMPRDFLCDGPFLVVMKNRESATPFLMVWVENEEVLAKPMD